MVIIINRKIAALFKGFPNRTANNKNPIYVNMFR